VVPRHPGGLDALDKGARELGVIFGAVLLKHPAQLHYTTTHIIVFELAAAVVVATFNFYPGNNNSINGLQILM
jgi:hypothetical protein